MEKAIKKCVYAGSFDPITNGHLWMIEQGSNLFDKLVVAIGINTSKQYTFFLQERLEMIRETTKQFDNVEIDSFENEFLVNYTARINAKYILRGIRSVKDYEMEKDMRHMNRDSHPEIETIFLFPPRELAEVSSSSVKSLIGFKTWEDRIKKYVPLPVYLKFLEKYKGK